MCCSSNNITNVTASNNSQYGLYFYRNSEYNKINDSRIENNTIYGIYFYNVTSDPA